MYIDLTYLSKDISIAITDRHIVSFVHVHVYHVGSSDADV